ncbi:MAG: M20 family metallopeptidase [Candidatus Hermodarchaeota archaeon]
MSEQLILEEIDQNTEEYIEFFRDLIKINSYNPPGNEKDVAVKIEKYLKDIGIKTELFPFDDNRANLIAYLNDNFEGKNLLYNGHMDIVPPGNINEWKYPPLSATIKRKKYIYGRGTVDMKSGLAAMAIALKILKKLKFELAGNLIFNAVADEETGGKYGAGWCLENKLQSIKCDFSIVGEPTGIEPLPQLIILGDKGRIILKLTTKGISSHSSIPFAGENAIYMMSEIIHNLNKLEEFIPKIQPPMSISEIKNLVRPAFPNNEIFERIYKENPILKDSITALTQFTVSLNMINSGIKDNVVPDECEAIIDIRTLPGQSIEDIINGFKKLINNTGYKVIDNPDSEPNDVYVHLEIMSQSNGSYWRNWKDSEVLKEFKKICDECYPKKSIYFLFPASSDAKYFRNSGYCEQTILFGPGNASKSHTIDENISIEDFLIAIKVYSLFAYEFLKKTD